MGSESSYCTEPQLNVLPFVVMHGSLFACDLMDGTLSERGAQCSCCIDCIFSTSSALVHCRSQVVVRDHELRASWLRTTGGCSSSRCAERSSTKYHKDDIC